MGRRGAALTGPPRPPPPPAPDFERPNFRPPQALTPSLWAPEGDRWRVPATCVLAVTRHLAGKPPCSSRFSKTPSCLRVPPWALPTAPPGPRPPRLSAGHKASACSRGRTGRLLLVPTGAVRPGGRHDPTKWTRLRVSTGNSESEGVAPSRKQWVGRASRTRRGRAGPSLVSCGPGFPQSWEDAPSGQDKRTRAVGCRERLRRHT